jgi:hypothetical protein
MYCLRLSGNNDHSKMRQYKQTRNHFFFFHFRLQLQKKNLGIRAEEVGIMQAENVEMTEQIDTLAESHK